MSHTNPPNQAPTKLLEAIDEAIRSSMQTTYAGKAPITAWEELHIPTLRQSLTQLYAQWLESLKPDSKNLSTSAYGLWVAHEIETRLQELRHG